jgi:hypothetical protein
MVGGSNGSPEAVLWKWIQMVVQLLSTDIRQTPGVNASHSYEKQGWNSQPSIRVKKSGQPEQFLGFVHITIRENFLWGPGIARVERNCMSDFSILPRPIKVNENRTMLIRNVENVGFPQLVLPQRQHRFREGDVLPPRPFSRWLQELVLSS